MALNTSKCNHLMPLRFKVLTTVIWSACVLRLCLFPDQLWVAFMNRQLIDYNRLHLGNCFFRRSTLEMSVDCTCGTFVRSIC